MSSSFRWYCNALSGEVIDVLRMELDIEVEGRATKGRPTRTWKKPVEKESVMVSVSRQDALCR